MIGPRTQRLIEQIAAEAVRSGTGKLSEQFSAHVGLPGGHPYWPKWKEAYYAALIEDATARVEAAAQGHGLPTPESIGQGPEIQPELMVHGTRYLLLHQSESQRHLRRSVLTFDRIATNVKWAPTRLGPMFIFHLRTRTTRQLFRAEIKEVHQVSPDTAYAWDERA
jgi:hypothetical protein